MSRGTVHEIAQAGGIVLLSTLSAITYGVLHDQVTAHLCVEYFSVAHPPIFGEQPAFILALGWGVVATWWVGLPLGLGLAVASRLGPSPRLDVAALKRPILWLMLATAAAALVSGLAGAWRAASGDTSALGGWAGQIPPEKHVAFAADLWAHTASYGFGALGGALLIGWAVWRRVRLGAFQGRVA